MISMLCAQVIFKLKYRRSGHHCVRNTISRPYITGLRRQELGRWNNIPVGTCYSSRARIACCIESLPAFLSQWDSLYVSFRHAYALS